MLIFWHDRQLAADLRDGRVVSRAKFLYFVILSVWATVNMSETYNDWHHEAATHMTKLADLLILVITIVGINICYDTNREGDDTDFIERITCLGLPVFVRMTVLSAAIVFPVAAAVKYFNLPVDMRMVFFVVSIVSNLYVYYRLNTGIRIASVPVGDTTPPSVIL